MKKFTLFLGALLISMVSMATNYVKVTAAPADWSGEYLLVYEGETSAHVWTGVDAVNGNVEATATDGTISGTDFVTITVAPMEGGYSIKVNGGANDGKYISGTTDKNKLNFGADAALNTLVYEDGSVKITSNTSVMRFNNAKDNMRFRYFKSSTYSGQKVVQLYKNADGTTPEEPETPDTPDTPEEPETPTVPEGAITCAEAVAICEQVGTTGTTEEYTVRGYITEIKYAWSEQYGTATFWIADAKDGENALQAYSCAPLKDADKVFAVGAYVELVGKLKKFNTTNEVEKGTYTIITPAEGGTTPEMPDTPEEPEVPEVTADTITCAEAATIAAAENYLGTDTITVVGYVTELGNAKEDGSKQCFYMADTKDGGKVFMAYWAFVSKLYVVGDKVAVTGILKNYNGTIEIVDGQSALLEAAAGENPETPDTPDEPEVPEVTIDTITCAEAATIAAAENYLGTDTITVVGYVTELGNAKEDGSKQCFYMADTKDGGKVFMAYWAFVSKLYVVGDKVAVTGILKNYNGTIEIVDGQSTLLEAAAGETPDDGGETPDDGGETPEDGKVTFAAASDKGNSTSDSNNAAEYTITKNGVTMVVSQGVVTDHYRIYKNQTLTISAAGKTITSIEITCTVAGEEKYGPGCFVTETPTYTYSEKIGTWTGEATEVTFTASLNQVRATQIVVTVAETSEDFVATPVISGEADFMDNTTVTITAEEGLEVYYTLDGTDPTKASTKYTAPFELTATTTVKAIAYNGDKASAVAEKTFSKMTILTCAEAVALCTNPATPGQHIIRGYVTEMIEAYNDKYKNITFWMADTKDGGQVLQAFRVKPFSDVEQSLKVGDFVEVIGSLILYTKDGVSIPEVNAGGSVKLITAGNTAVDNVTVDQQATKFIQNGQLIIIKNGVQYNALGQVIK